MYIVFRNEIERKRVGGVVVKCLPPGPPGLPVIGNLHQFGNLAHRSLRDLADKYGPIMYLRLGSVPTVVVSSPEIAKEVRKAHDLIFANRPETGAGKYTGYDSTDVAFAPYGPYWRHVRKVFVLELVTPKRIQSSRPVIEEEVSLLISGMLCDSQKGKVAVDVSKKLSSMTNNIICRMAFGKKYADEDLDSTGFKKMLKELFTANGVFNFGDFIPWMDWMDAQGIRRRQKKVHRTFDIFFEKIIAEHVERRMKSKSDVQDRPQDFVDVLLTVSENPNMEVKITRDNIKALLFDALGGGTDTSAATLEWAMSELLRKPHAMRKAQAELDYVVGRDRKVEEYDLPRLEFLQCIVKETMRLRPVAPLLLPHESMEPCTIGGYHIPAKTRLIINGWAIGQSAAVWEDAEEFKPERFLGSGIDIKGQDFAVIPFGSGRRGCPGISLALTIVQFSLARMLQCFEWRLPGGISVEELDMSESFGMTMPRAVHLLAVPTPRLPQHLYL
eukprot:Gb_28863 [translate_table: standard]